MKRGINLIVLSCLILCLIFTSILSAISYFNGKSFLNQMLPFYTAVIWCGAVFIGVCIEGEKIKKMCREEKIKYFKSALMVFFLIIPLAVVIIRILIKSLLLKNILFILLLPFAILLWCCLMKKNCENQGHSP